MSKYTHIVIQLTDDMPKAITLNRGQIMSTPAHTDSISGGMYNGYVIRLPEADAEKLAADVRASGTVLETRVVPWTTINPRNQFVNKTAK